jgi:hypothetical protein
MPDTMKSEVIEEEVVTEVKTEKSLAQWTPKFVVSVDEAVARHDERIDYLKRVLKEGVHYGVIPGTGNKPALLKPGAESLMADMGLRPDPTDEQPPVLDFAGVEHDGESFIHYQRKVNLYRLHPQTGERIWVGAGSGSCNSWEEKYRWRTQVRTCPRCKQEAIIKGRKEYGGGWLCFKKKGGCGAKFPDGDKAIEDQPLGRVANDRVADLANTILKMADKRAMVAAVLNTTGVSDLFTQDVEDAGEMDDEERARMEASREVAPAKPVHKDDSPPADARPKTPMDETSQGLIRTTIKYVIEETRRGNPKAQETQQKWKAWFDGKGGPGSWTGLWADDTFTYAAFKLLGLGDPVKTKTVERTPEEGRAPDSDALDVP